VALIQTHLSSLGSEAALVARLQARDSQAFEELLDRFQDPIYRFVYRLLEDPSEAPDVTQEVFLKVFRKVRSFRGDCSLKTWIYRIAMNEASNRRRWFSRHKRQESSFDSPADEKNGWSESFADPGPTPFEATYRREQWALIDRALRDVDDRLRVTVILRDIEDLSYNEIAAILGISLGTVKSRILRGREALKDNLQRHLPAETPEACLLQPE
jgi:RNA polymerase sigma-70 factor (ECF subfamily)